MLDAGGSEVAVLVRPAMHIHPTFTVSRPGRSEVTIRKANFAPVMETWRIEGAEEGDIDLHGDVLNHEFTFEHAGQVVGPPPDGGSPSPTRMRSRRTGWIPCSPSRPPWASTRWRTSATADFSGTRHADRGSAGRPARPARDPRAHHRAG